MRPNGNHFVFAAIGAVVVNIITHKVLFNFMEAIDTIDERLAAQFCVFIPHGLFVR